MSDVEHAHTFIFLAKQKKDRRNKMKTGQNKEEKIFIKLCGDEDQKKILIVDSKGRSMSCYQTILELVKMSNSDTVVLTENSVALEEDTKFPEIADDALAILVN